MKPLPLPSSSSPRASRAQATSEALMAFLFLLSVIIVLSAATNRFSGAVQTRLTDAARSQAATLEHFKRDIYVSQVGIFFQVPLHFEPCAQTDPSLCSDFDSNLLSHIQTYAVSHDVPI
ncbi:MAG: hypothetical protein V1728_03140 [Candidatus Micrarchaeota archaeon]